MAADERMFVKLHLPKGYRAHYVKWLEPEKNESYEHYLERLSVQLITSRPFMIAGMSLGGLVATDFAHLLQPEKLILFSTVTTRKELPLMNKIAAVTHIHKLTPVPLIRIPTPFTYWLFGAYTQDSKKLLRDYLRTCSANYLIWALHQQVNWKNTQPYRATFHIHGEKDAIFPLHRVHPDHVVKDAGHMMVYTHAPQVNDLLRNFL